MAFMLLIALGGVQLTSGIGRARAEVFTCGTRSHYFDGKDDDTPDNYLGASATLSERFGAVCDTVTDMSNFVTTWVMIAGSNGFDAGWAQSGYFRWYNHCNVTFAQDARAQTITDSFFGTTCQQDGGQLNTFTEQYESACSCINEMEGTRTLLSTSFDPKNVWSTPWSPEFNGEAIYTQRVIQAIL